MRSDNWIALTLTLLLSWPLVAPAQQQTSPSAATDLKIVVVSGAGSKNDIIAKYAQDVVVKVVDASNAAVAGAEVAFQLPMAGPSARFSDGTYLHRTKTDAEGLAKARAVVPNDQAGPFSIKVTAQEGTKMGATTISQMNVRDDGSAPGKSRKKLWIALGVIGVAAIAGGIAASANGDSAAADTRKPVVIAPGPIVVGGPR